MREGGPGEPPDEAVVGSEYYDRTDYFEGRGDHLTDPDSPFQRYRLEKVLGLYQPGKDERVLDLGCGWGTFSFAVAEDVAGVVGVDFSERSIALCRKRLAREPHPNLRFLCADAADTGLPDEHFDLIIAADLVEHLYPLQTRAVLAESHRVLKRGGKLAIWTPHRGHILEILKNRRLFLEPDPTHVDYKSMARLKQELPRAGFSLERAYYVESHLPVLRGLERALMRVVPPLRRRIAVLARKS